MQVFDSIVNAIFPQKCISCGEIIDKGEFLCEYCYEKIERVDFSKVCERCGLPKKECECKNRVFHFNSVIAPFTNGDIAKAAMYRFKFKKLAFCSNFFAAEMAKTVKMFYYDVDFDGVAFVPMHIIKQLRRGFNQSEELAKRIAKMLGKPLYRDVLSVKYTSKAQHNMSVEERFKNVKGKYRFNYKVTGKNILLVDDIKTTGATVDECAKQLLLAGANSVYCITGQISIPKKGKK